MSTIITVKDGLDKALGRAGALLNAACTLAEEDERASDDLFILVCMASELVGEAIELKTQLYRHEVTHERSANEAL